MKNSLYPLFLIFALAIAGCDMKQNFSASDLKANSETKQEVFSTIINDNELLNDFIGQMMSNSGAMHQMMMNKDMMQHMFDEDNMQMMRQMSPDMMQMMMDNMMQMAGSDSSFQHQMMGNPHFQNMMEHRDGKMDMQN